MLLGVDVSGPGRVFVNGRLVKRRVRSAASAKRVWIPVIARGKALKRLRKRGKSRVAAFVSFRPNGGTRAARRRLVLVLVQKPVRGKSKRRRTSR